MKARRRAVVVTALVATAMLLPVSAAHAAVNATINTPTSGVTVTSLDADVTVSVSTPYGSGECPDWARVGRYDPETSDLLHAQDLAAQNGCLNLFPGTRQWAAELTWRQLMPDGVAPSCNGEHFIAARAQRMGSRTSQAVGFVLSLTPAAPTSVKVATQARQATVSWQAPAHPDLTGFDVQQKRPSSDEWATVRTVGKGTTSVTLTNLDPGPIEFRVRAVRGDGFTPEGDPATPCSDTGRDLASAWSARVSGTVPAPSASPSPSPTEGSTEPGDDATEPTDESTEPTEVPTEELTEEPTEPEASPSPTPTSRPRTPSRAAPPPVESQARRDVDAPEVSQPERPERYYGEDEEYSEELDFGAAPPEDQDREPGTVSIRVPGGLHPILGVELDLDRALAPVAGGMILLSLGLHLRRWTRLGQV